MYHFMYDQMYCIILLMLLRHCSFFMTTCKKRSSHGCDNGVDEGIENIMRYLFLSNHFMIKSVSQ